MVPPNALAKRILSFNRVNICSNFLDRAVLRSIHAKDYNYNQIKKKNICGPHERFAEQGETSPGTRHEKKQNVDDSLKVAGTPGESDVAAVPDDSGIQTAGEESDAEEMPESPQDVRESIKQKFLVEMPRDFYDFWEFCKSLNKHNPEGNPPALRSSYSLLQSLFVLFVTYNRLCGCTNSSASYAEDCGGIGTPSSDWLRLEG